MKTIYATILAVGLVSSLQAATLVFNGVLQGSQENPANASPGTGAVSLTVDSVTRIWSLTGNFSGLNGNTTAAHIHGPAAPGVNAAVLTSLTPTLGVTFGSISGAGTFSVSNYNSLVSELLYVNLHTSSFGGGELRAQLIPEPSAAILGAVAGLGLLRRRRRA